MRGILYRRLGFALLALTISACARPQGVWEYVPVDEIPGLPERYAPDYLIMERDDETLHSVTVAARISRDGDAFALGDETRNYASFRIEPGSLFEPCAVAAAEWGSGRISGWIREDGAFAEVQMIETEGFTGMDACMLPELRRAYIAGNNSPA